MKDLLETICIRDGLPQNLEWHQRRVDATLHHFYSGHHHSWNLLKCIEVPAEFQSGIVRCRIVYDAHHINIQFSSYTARVIHSLKLVEVPAGYEYGYKYADRQVIEDLFSGKGEADDILMMRNGWLMDTSIANIAFEKKGRWYTPSIPLLAGTTWKRLVCSGVLIPRLIHREDITNYDSFKVFNAMNEFTPGRFDSRSTIGISDIFTGRDRSDEFTLHFQK